MELRDQEATPEQKATIKKLHNDDVKKFKISGYIIAALCCVGATFLLRLKAPHQTNTASGKTGN